MSLSIPHYPSNPLFLSSSEAELPWIPHLKEKMHKLAIMHLPIIDQLQAKKEYLKNIHELNKKIQLIDQELASIKENHQTRMAHLEDRKRNVDSIFLIGAVFRMTKKQKLKIENEYQFTTEALAQKKEDYLRQITHFSQALQRDEADEFANLLEIEWLWRECLSKNFSNRNDYLNIYFQKILPLLNEKKHSFKTKPKHLVIQTIGKKGKIFNAFTSTLKQLAENQPVLKRSLLLKSSRETFQLVNEGLTFQVLNDREIEEIHLMSSILDLIISCSYLESHFSKEASLCKLGMQHSFKQRDRGYLITKMPEALRMYFKECLPISDLLFICNQDYFSKKGGEIYITPDLSDPEDRLAYEHCEKFQWIYHESHHHKQIITFKQLHAIYLIEKHLDHAKPVELKEPFIHSYLDRALKVKWKAMSSEIMKEVSPTSMAPLEDVLVKPIPNTIIPLKNLTERARLKAFGSLSTQGQALAILTSELQFLNLDSEKVGIIPKSNEDYENYKGALFKLPIADSTIDFPALAVFYLEGLIKPNTHIQIFIKESMIEGPFKRLHSLRNVLEGKWNLILLNLNEAFSETNFLQYHFHNGNIEHSIPLHTFLLSSACKNIPLSKNMIQKLLHNEEIELRLRKWIEKDDAPIYQFLSPNLIMKIKDYLIPILEKYSLSHFRQDNINFSHHDLCLQFATDLAKFSGSNFPFWKEIENEMRDKKINIDLTQFSRESLKERKKIAFQFFPRMSPGQLQALLERQNRRKEYLSNYQRMQELTIEKQEVASSTKREEIVTKIKQYIEHPSTPLTKLERKYFLTIIRDKEKLLIDYSFQLRRLKNQLLEKCKPTYFNLDKAMYPLLADVYELYVLVYSEEYACHRIGHSHYPIERVIRKAKAQFSSLSDAFRLAEHLEKEIPKH